MTTQFLKTKTTGVLRIIQLDRPKALNALGLELMIELRNELTNAFADESIKTIWLESTQSKAFCAGGDVKALAIELDTVELGIEKTALGRKYFELEYGLDLLIEQSPKPIVVFAEGITFGGGWGLFAGGNVRLCTDSATFAMPENQIGFYPDVGAAFFLQRPDWKQGTFLGLGGFPITANEALALDYVDDVISVDYAEVLKAQLSEGIDAVELDIQTSNTQLADIRLQWRNALKLLPEDASLSDWVTIIEDHADEFECFQRAKQNWMTGSAWSLAVTWHYFRRMRDADRAAVLAQDLNIGANFCAEPEFYEGVHAKLIDKQRAPQWQYPHVESVPIDDIIRVLES